jgi:hypothetical protein
MAISPGTRSSQDTIMGSVVFVKTKNCWATAPTLAFDGGALEFIKVGSHEKKSRSPRQSTLYLATGDFYGKKMTKLHRVFR